jgi:hypothetical protein
VLGLEEVLAAVVQAEMAAAAMALDPMCRTSARPFLCSRPP